MKKTREQGNFPLRSRTGGAFAAHTADVAKVVTLPFSTQQVSLMAGVLRLFSFKIEIRSTMLRVTFCTAGYRAGWCAGRRGPAKGTVLEVALHHVADVVGVEGVVGELAGLADRRAGQRGVVGCLLQACRLEVVSEGLLQVALGRGSGWPAGRRFPESCLRGMVWRPPCTEILYHALD